MVAIKTHQADAFLKNLDRIPAAILLYGTDAGLVMERSVQLAKRLAERENPPGEILSLDDASLEADPDRLFVELQTVAMFGGRKIVRAVAGRRLSAATLKPLIEAGSMEGFLIVEAAGLRPEDALRSLFEKSPAAAAIACFPDQARDLEGVVQRTLAAADLQITPAAKKLLIGRLGADRALSRTEVEKLALFAFGRGTVEEADVEAAVGDAAELALEKITMAAGSKRLGVALSEYDRSVAAGENPQAIIAAVQRHFLRLHRMRSALDAGRSMEEVVRLLRPPVHFRQREQLEQQCRTWTTPALEAVLARTAAALKQARLGSGMESVLAENLLLEIGRLGAPGP